MGLRLRYERYWFKEDELMEPLDWGYIKSLPKQVAVALQSYMGGRFPLARPLRCQV